MKWLAAVVTLAACAEEPRLQVLVEHAPGYDVKRTVVSVYEQTDLSCIRVEFGDIDGDVLRGALTSESAEGGTLTNLSRTEPKIIVARGYDMNGALVTAGCAEKAEVTGEETVTVTTVAAATVTTTVAENGLLITTTDAMNASIDHRRIAWRIYGAAGTSADPTKYNNVSDGVWEPKQPTCTEDGDTTIHPMPPKLPGGFGLRLGVSWAATPQPLITSFTPIDIAGVTLGGVGDANVVEHCAIQKHGSQVRIVCMPDANTAVEYTYNIAATALTPSAPSALPNLINDQWIGVVTIDGANGDRDVYAISERGTWQALFGAPSANAGSWCGALPLRCTPGAFKISQIKVVPPCGSSPGFLLGRANEGAPFRRVPLRGGAGAEYPTPNAIEINNAGCVTELTTNGDTAIRQAVVLNGVQLGANAVTSPRVTMAVFDCSASATRCVAVLPTANAGVGFAGGSEPRMVGTTFDATGATIDQWVLLTTNNNKSRLVTRGRQVAAAPPRQLITARLDADNEPDLLWTFSARSDVSVQVAYARQAERAPLTAITTLANAGTFVQPTSLFAADFNGDKYDEIVAVSQVGAGTATTTRITAVPTGIPYTDQPTPGTDTPCP